MEKHVTRSLACGSTRPHEPHDWTDEVEVGVMFRCYGVPSYPDYDSDVPADVDVWPPKLEYKNNNNANGGDCE